jgi:O-antigen/teichoic acid export membrane protein
MFSTSLSGVFFPKISMMVENNASIVEFTSLMIKVGRIQYMILSFIISGFVLFGKAFINLWAGNNYSDAYYIVLIVMIPFTIDLIQNVGISILQAKNLHGFRSIVFILIAVLNILVSIPLAKAYGGVGCAIATGISLIIGNFLIMNIYYHRRIGLNIPLFWKNIGFISIPVLISLVFGYGINQIDTQDSILFLACKIVLFSLSFLSVMWLMGFNDYEKNLFYSVAKRFINKRARLYKS